MRGAEGTAAGDREEAPGSRRVAARLDAARPL